jgi:hypothetical protein
MRTRLLALGAALLALGVSCSDPAAPRMATTLVASPGRDLGSSDASAGSASPIRSRLDAARCLDVVGASQDPGVPVILWSCHGESNQQFVLPALGTAGEVRVYGTMCLDVLGGGEGDDDLVGISTCTGAVSQRWTVTDRGEIRGLGDRCVDVAGADPTPGARVLLWSCHGGANQVWDIVAAPPAEPPPAPPAVFVGAGDIAGCAWTGDEATAALLDGIPGVVWAAGDVVYQDGTAEEFATCYEPSWGRHKARTRPAPGNHEYNTPNAAPYYAYFGEAAGPAGRGYYSYDVGAWHVVSLNSNVDVSTASAQVAWLRADLAANPRACTLAYWHHPRFSSGGSSTRLQPLWQVLYEAGAEVVLVGHVHNYERFAPQTATGGADPARGIREFVVGTGGVGLTRTTPTVLPNSEFLNGSHRGVLKLELAATSYRWSFITTEGATLDAGEAGCH